MNIKESKIYKDWEGFCKLNDIKEDDFVLGGSAILAVKGIRQRIRDLDIIIINPTVWEKLLANNSLEKSESTVETVISLNGGKIELKNEFLPSYKKFKFDHNSKKDVEEIDGLKIMTLRVVERYKRILRRPKDLRDRI